ncbi:MAG: hypothetical protein ACQERE_07165 [Pseudomonadota bacterium]
MRRLWEAIAILLLLTLTVPAFPSGTEDQDAIALWQRNHQSPAIRELVEMLLAKTPDYGPTRIRPSVPMAQARAIRQLRAGNTDTLRIANVASSRQRNRTLRPVSIPIDQGMLGFRVCLIRKGEQHRFEGIFTAGQFQQRDLTIGQGSHWPDTRILRDSGFRVITAPQFQSLLTMLERERFDCFLRGVGEALIDLDQYGGDRLTVEERLVFTYRMPSYLFVAPDDERMAERLSTGLYRAMLDGDYDRWFTTYFRDPIRKLNVMDRVFIPLPNPFFEGGGSPAQLPLLPIRPDFYLTVPEGTR